VAFKVVIERRASKELGNLPPKAYRSISRAIDAISINPRLRGYIKLEGEDDLYRYRVGDYRIIYQISDQTVTIVIIKISHRKDVYRK